MGKEKKSERARTGLANSDGVKAISLCEEHPLRLKKRKINNLAFFYDQKYYIYLDNN